MAGENLGVTGTNTDQGNAGGDDAVHQDTANTANQDDIDAMVQKLVQEQLSPIKQKLDKAYEERDNAARALSQAKELAKAAEIERLQAEGKDVEALRLQLSELQGKYEAAVSQNTKLTRDQMVDSALAGLQFKNDTARRLAKADLIADLVQNADGQWQHKTGASISDAIEVYSKDESNSFMFVQKNSTGSATITPISGTATASDPKAPFMTKPITELTTEEMMQAVKAGRFGESQPRGAFGQF